MNDPRVEKQKPVPPFVQFCCAAIPQVFDDSLSYYEALCAMWKYLDETVKVINNNAMVTEDFIAKVNELHDYVENYFANLDVQEEINNKLDQMAEDGTLQEIITTYIQANVAWTFDTVADMKSATNLIAGSYARTLGFYSINDGGGATYYITDSGTANEMDVIAIDSLYANLVSEKVINPVMFGAVGDGTTDDSLNIQECINYGKANNITVIDGLNKNYIVSDVVIIPDTISSVNELGIYIDYGVTLRNIKLKLKDGCQSLTSVLNIANPTETNVFLENITINGNKSNQSSALSTQDGGLHGIRVGFPNHSAGGFKIVNSYIYDCYTDDIDIRALDFDSVEISSCKIKGAGRNGITDNSKNSLVDNCTFLDNGTRTNPKSAYHIEPDSTFDFGIKTISNCYIDDNGRPSIQIHFNSDAYNFDTFNIINCKAELFYLSSLCNTACTFNKFNIIDSTFTSTSTNGITKDAGTKLEFNDITITRSSFLGNFIIVGSESNVKTNVYVNDNFFSRVLQLRNGFGDILIDGCRFIKDEYPSGTGVETLAIALSYITTQETYTADTLTVTNCYLKNYKKFIYNKSSGSSRVAKNITNLNVSNNTYVSEGDTYIDNDGNITNFIMKGNNTSIGGTGYKRYLVGTCANLIAVDNISSFGSSQGFNTDNITTGLITNNIFNGVIQVAE